MPANKQDQLDAELIISVAQEAGRIAKEYFDRRSVEVWEKSKDNPVSEADLAVNEFMRRTLLEARPDYGWLSEESALADHRRDQKRIFIVDPIDGTKAFIAGKPDWCVGIAVVEDGVVRAGAVDSPILDTSYDAVKAGGARLNGAAISVSNRATLNGARMVNEDGLFKHPAWPEPWPEMEFTEPRPNATLLRLCWVASGAWDGTATLARKSDWDLAPATLIVEEAGGLATTHQNEPFRFNRTIPAQKSVLAAGKDLHSLLHARMKFYTLADPNNP